MKASFTDTAAGAASKPAVTLRARVLTSDLTEERERFRALLEAEHALGKRQPSGHTLYQIIEERRDGCWQWVALLQWGACARHLADRDQWIGWDARMASQRLGLIVNNHRFLVLEASRRPNLASQSLAVASRALPDQWLEAFGYQPALAETFTDPESHAGTCYKAAGWIPVGFTAGAFRYHRCDYYNSHDKRPKRLWLKELLPNARARLLSESLAPEHLAAQSEGGSSAQARSALKADQLESLAQCLWHLPDPRRKCGRRYPLGAVLAIVVLALLQGEKDIRGFQRTGSRLNQRQRARLGLRLKRGSKFFRPAPGYDVYREVLHRIDGDVLAQTLSAWLQVQAGKLPSTLAIDGKTISDQLGIVITLSSHQDLDAAVGLTAANSHGQEARAAEKLLRQPQTNLVGNTVAADALHGRRPTGRAVAEKGGDYILAIKGNAPKTFEEVKRVLAPGFVGSSPFFS